VTAKAYIFPVWPPEGDDCPSAVAAVVAGSLSGARTAIRRAGVRLVRKDPSIVIRDPDVFKDLPADQVVWRYDHEETWRSL
jgi:hypothetical protein